MKKKIGIGFALLFLIFSISIWLTPDKEYSVEERRKLQQMPDFSAESILKGKALSDFEEYMKDQFPFRNIFRKLYVFGEHHIIGRKEINNYYEVDGNIGLLEYPLQENAVAHAANLFCTMGETIFADNPCYYTIIPDKNYYLAKEKGYPCIDYEQMEHVMEQGMGKIPYISVFESVTAADYYRTDLHIRQENIVDLANALLEGMNNPYRADIQQFEMKNQGEFLGGYGAAYGRYVKQDELLYLVSDYTNNSIVYDHETKSQRQIYEKANKNSPDAYDVFLGGARALLEIENPLSEEEKELIIIRDSFAGAYIPVMLGGYRKITLIDLRYCASSKITDYIEINPEADVLFACNASVLNQSYMLK